MSNANAMTFLSFIVRFLSGTRHPYHSDPIIEWVNPHDSKKFLPGIVFLRSGAQQNDHKRLRFVDLVLDPCAGPLAGSLEAHLLATEMSFSGGASIASEKRIEPLEPKPLSARTSTKKNRDE